MKTLVGNLRENLQEFSIDWRDTRSACKWTDIFEEWRVFHDKAFQEDDDIGIPVRLWHSTFVWCAGWCEFLCASDRRLCGCLCLDGGLSVEILIPGT